MAPEQLEGKPTVASDIYALGVTPTSCDGRLPFNPDSPFQLRELHGLESVSSPVICAESSRKGAQSFILKARPLLPRIAMRARRTSAEP